MDKLFNKAICFTDIHFGRKNNEKRHNEDCSLFVDFMLSEAKKENADAIIFTGDWHDNRHTVQVSTLNYTVQNLKKINDSKIQTYFIPGNHDLFYREKRDVTSVIMAEDYENIKLIDEIYHKKGVTFFPWLIKDDWKTIPKYCKKSDYVFGHFEIPTFLMNAKTEMPDHNELQVSHFNDVGYWAFSGHFHKRQAKGKICYLGNSFPLDFNDNWDDDRGIMILEWGKDPIFKKWDRAPKFRTIQLSELLEDMDLYLDDLTNIKVVQDIELSYEENLMIKEIIFNHYNPRKFEMKRPNSNIEDIETKDITFQSIDQIVLDGLDMIESNTIDKKRLISIFGELKI